MQTSLMEKIRVCLTPSFSTLIPPLAVLLLLHPTFKMHFWHKRCGHEHMITVVCVCDSGGRILVSIIILSTVKSSRNGRKSDSKDFGRGRKRSFYWLYKILFSGSFFLLLFRLLVFRIVLVNTLPSWY